MVLSFISGILAIPVSALTVLSSAQDITAYVDSALYSGNLPYQGACAVHPHQASDWPNTGSGPAKYPFGTTVVLSTPVPMYGSTSTRSTFTVEDTGDLNFVCSPNWVDIWQGQLNDIGAKNWCSTTFGKRTSDVTFYVTI